VLTVEDSVDISLFFSSSEVISISKLFILLRSTYNTFFLILFSALVAVLKETWITLILYAIA
jgi:hypothetical protein